MTSPIDRTSFPGRGAASHAAFKQAVATPRDLTPRAGISITRFNRGWRSDVESAVVVQFRSQQQDFSYD